MRIRTIKPSFWRSDDITALPMDVRLLFVGLWSYVDDNGVGIDDYRQITADLFALEDDQNAYRTFVREGLATLSRRLMLVRYMVDDKPLIFITKWDLHQKVDRPNKPRFPRPPADFDPSTSTNGRDPQSIATPSRDLRETPSSVVGNRGTEEQRKKSKPSSRDARRTDRFDEFYLIYPRHVARRAAEKAWTAAIKAGVDEQHIIDGATRYANSCKGKDSRYIKHPATWLNGECWDDEPDPRVDSAPVATTDRRIAEAELLKDNPNPAVLAAAGIPIPTRLKALRGGAA
jgi:hypothetical protein